jgi:hypothetical protein
VISFDLSLPQEPVACPAAGAAVRLAVDDEVVGVVDEASERRLRAQRLGEGR